MAVLSNWVFLEILHEAGLPKGVIQFIPGEPSSICSTAFAHPDFASLHYTGSTAVFKSLWKQIVSNIDNLKSYPRIVGETGGKNYHLLHPSANVDVVAYQTIRAGYEYSGRHF
jgi:1-pyrroline-5-carboxylate dehydrogenase